MTARVLEPPLRLRARPFNTTHPSQRFFPWPVSEIESIPVHQVCSPGLQDCAQPPTAPRCAACRSLETVASEQAALLDRYPTVPKLAHSASSIAGARDLCIMTWCPLAYAAFTATACVPVTHPRLVELAVFDPPLDLPHTGVCLPGFPLGDSCDPDMPNPTALLGGATSHVLDNRLFVTSVRPPPLGSDVFMYSMARCDPSTRTTLQALVPGAACGSSSDCALSLCMNGNGVPTRAGEVGTCSTRWITKTVLVADGGGQFLACTFIMVVLGLLGTAVYWMSNRGSEGAQEDGSLSRPNFTHPSSSTDPSRVDTMSTCAAGGHRKCVTPPNRTSSTTTSSSRDSNDILIPPRSFLPSHDRNHYTLPQRYSSLYDPPSTRTACRFNDPDLFNYPTSSGEPRRPMSSPICTASSGHNRTFSHSSSCGSPPPQSRPIIPRRLRHGSMAGFPHRRDQSWNGHTAVPSTLNR